MVWWFANLFAAGDPLLLWIAIFMFLYIFATIFLVNGIKQGLKRLKVSRGLNRFLTLAACFLLPMIMTGIVVNVFVSANRAGAFERNPENSDAIPLSVADFMDVDMESYVQTNGNHETFLLGQMHVNAFPHWDYEGFHELPDLEYTDTTVKVPALYNWCKAQIFRDADETNNNIPEGHRNVYKEVDAAPWGAELAYRIYQEEGWWENQYLLCYKDRIIEIEFDWEPSAEDMAITENKLNP